MRVGVILNPASGRRQATSLRERLDHLASAWDATFDIRELEQTERIEDAVRAWDGRMDAIGAVGGDGTLNGVVNGVLTSGHPETPVFFVPTGRGKDTARTLGSWSTERVGTALPRSSRRLVDVGLVSSADGDRFFINASSVGVSAFTARQASGYPRWLGSSSYLLAAVPALVHERPFEASLSIDDQPRIGMPRCHVIVVANGRFFGGGMPVAPEAEPDDGMFDVLALADATPRDLATALPMLLRGIHLRHPKVRHWRAQRVSLETTGHPLIESDGEQWTSGAASFTVMPRILTWLEPS